MKNTYSSPIAPFATILAVAIILVWCVVALLLDQHLLAAQKSKLLMTVGAADGELLSNGQWWRIVTSQFLHVHFLHMLFNAGCVVVIGSFIEKRYGWWSVAAVYFCGGSIGQIASVVSYPDLVSSGASQALMALCGAALLIETARSPKLLVLAIIAIQVALDVYVAQKVKAGHSFGFLGGLLAGSALLLFRGSQSISEPSKPMQPTCEDARTDGRR
ncbi:MAG TPA: rhomboid family intramembrane serine protease [Povalibacter sp.]|uniref:rhomboid family intramembrane serine protease n=1 Tax=Povalibacter sp. TaxID=1962978 RepID=UPI002CE1B04A|nr:rhomboid family intramembrane serine protease [Povalibacter sp.]HMN45389.1 rhomboid family intramembrane serine protease [Povalibacter sp.]